MAGNFRNKIQSKWIGWKFSKHNPIQMDWLEIFQTKSNLNGLDQNFSQCVQSKSGWKLPKNSKSIAGLRVCEYFGIWTRNGCGSGAREQFNGLSELLGQRPRPTSPRKKEHTLPSPDMGSTADQSSFLQIAKSINFSKLNWPI